VAVMLSPGVVCYVFKHAPKLTPRAKVLKLADKISNLRSLATSPPADWPMQRRADYVM